MLQRCRRLERTVGFLRRRESLPHLLLLLLRARHLLQLSLQLVNGSIIQLNQLDWINLIKTNWKEKLKKNWIAECGWWREKTAGTFDGRAAATPPPSDSGIRSRRSKSSCDSRDSRDSWDSFAFLLSFRLNRRFIWSGPLLTSRHR